MDKRPRRGMGRKQFLGHFMDIERGASISVSGGSMRYVFLKGGTLFKLGEGDRYGECLRFLCQGVMFGLPYANCRMIDCTWPSGTITFIGCDDSSEQTRRTEATGGSNAFFHSIAANGPVISWIGCVLQGKHAYAYGSGVQNSGCQISYANCRLWHARTAEEFIVYLQQKPADEGNAPIVEFTHCQGASEPGEPSTTFDTLLRWNVGSRGSTVTRYLRLSDPGNRLPKLGFAEEVELPPDALIVGIRLFMPPSTLRSRSHGWSYTVRTKELLPTVLLKAVPAGDDPRRGANEEIRLLFACDSRPKRTIVLASSLSVLESAEGFCLIEYLA